jgi:hypothetical protein
MLQEIDEWMHMGQPSIMDLARVHTIH